MTEEMSLPSFSCVELRHESDIQAHFEHGFERDLACSLKISITASISLELGTVSIAIPSGEPALRALHLEEWNLIRSDLERSEP